MQAFAPRPAGRLRCPRHRLGVPVSTTHTITAPSSASARAARVGGALEHRRDRRRMGYNHAMAALIAALFTPLQVFPVKYPKVPEKTAIGGDEPRQQFAALPWRIGAGVEFCWPPRATRGAG